MVEIEKKLQIVKTNFGTFVVDTNDLIGASIAKQGAWEYHLQDFYTKVIKGDDVIIDAGANIGYLTVQFAKLAKKVYAFEPQRYVFNILSSNILFNNLNDKVEQHRLGLGDIEEFRQLWSIENENFGQVWNYGGRGLEWEDSHYKPTGEEREEDVIKVMPLDSFNIKKCDLLKLDVQGFEWQLIYGGTETIERNLPIVLLESAPERSNNDKKVLEYFKKLGYTNFRYYINNNEDCILVHKNNARYAETVKVIETLNKDYNIKKEF